MSKPGDISGDPALLELFRAELDTHLPVLGEGLLALEKGRAGDQDIAAMMRAAHSIKGAARIVGSDAIVRIAHVLEDCFTAAQVKRITLTSAAVDILLQGVDALQRISALQPDPEIDEPFLTALQERIASVRDGRLPDVVERAAPSAPPPPSTLPAATEVMAAQPCAPELRLVLPVEFDDGAAEQLWAELPPAVRGGARTIRLDFRQVRRVSAGALALLAALAREVTKSDTPPALAADGVTGPLATLLHVTGLDRTLAASSQASTP